MSVRHTKRCLEALACEHPSARCVCRGVEREHEDWVAVNALLEAQGRCKRCDLSKLALIHDPWRPTFEHAFVPKTEVSPSVLGRARDSLREWHDDYIKLNLGETGTGCSLCDEAGI